MERTEIPKKMQNAAAWAKWRGAARRFESLGKQLEEQADLRNIRLDRYGYQVVFHHKDNYLSRFFAGFEEESLERAKQFRDEVLQKRAGRRKNHVPAEVLLALGLAKEVKGIYRLASRSVYRVEYRTPGGQVRQKQFYFRRVPEADAYAAAIGFLRAREAGKVR